MNTPMNRQHIVVIGSGVAGLASAWLLSTRHEVTLIEKNDYIGGHTHTIEVDNQDQPALGVDTGFIVYNTPNYPNLVGLLKTLDVETRATKMSFAVSAGEGRLEYAGSNLGTLFAQKRNILRPRFLKMVRDILAFNEDAKNLLSDEQTNEQTVGEFIESRGYGDGFTNDYLLPMAAAIWSCPPDQMKDFPALSFARFFNNHGLLNIKDRPQWRTIVGGSHVYVKKMLQDFNGSVISNNRAVSVSRESEKVIIKLLDGSTLECDQVVMATHADEALGLLDKPTSQEKSLLGAFQYQPNDTYLHTDRRLMPVRNSVWSSWNYITRQTGEKVDSVSVTYWMNHLQGLDASEDYFVSLNPVVAPDPDKVIRRINYHHPVFDNAAMQAQTSLDSIQGQHNCWFAGSYFGYGFHEDAIASAVNVCRTLGITPPWEEQSVTTPASVMRAA